MARNKYIYCLADYGLVVRSDEGKGGTWSGAIDNLKKQWVPLFVKSESDASGNAALIAQGASALLIDKKDIGKTGSEPLRTALGMCSGDGDVESDKKTAVSEAGQACDEAAGTLDDSTAEAEIDVDSKPAEEGHDDQLIKQLGASITDTGPNAFYSVFVGLLKLRFNEDAEVKLEDFKKDFPEIMPKQLTAWFDRAEEEGLIERKGKRRIYTLKGDSSQTVSENLDLQL